jgi:hypothetical protein
MTAFSFCACARMHKLPKQLREFLFCVLDRINYALFSSCACAGRYKLPKQLREFKVVCAAAIKPLTLLALLHELRGRRTLVFTASVEATHRCAASACLCVGGERVCLCGRPHGLHEGHAHLCVHVCVWLVG